MTITLTKAELLQAIRHRSHKEVAGIADVEARYKVEANLQNDEEVFQAMAMVSGSLTQIVNRFLLDSYDTDDADNTLEIPSSYVYEFDLTTRASEGKRKALASMMHGYFVDATLARFYAAVSQAELAEKHNTLATNLAASIESFLFSKKAPTL